MAQKVQTILIDDIEGTEVEQGGETITFSIDAFTYEIDLSDKNAKKMRDALKFYADHGRRVSGRASTATARRSPVSQRDSDRLKVIREWARANGHEVSDRGRVSRRVQDAYDAAH